jgi:hypothetical protein
MKSLVVTLAAFSTATLLLSVIDGAPSSQEVPSSWREAGERPPGYLLAFSSFPTAAIFKVELDGNVSHPWSYDPGIHDYFNDNLFAVDVERELVYLGMDDLFAALDLNTGEVRVQIPVKPPYYLSFWNYDYVAKDNAIYGACTDYNVTWYWCRIKLHEVHLQKIKIEYLYKLLPAETVYSPPGDFIYFMDKHHQSIWYSMVIDAFVIGINYTTGEMIFRGLAKLDIPLVFWSCIAHDYSLNRTFTLSSDTHPLLAELHPTPQDETVLMELPLSLECYVVGTCAYYEKTHTLMALMTDSDRMLYYLVSIDVVQLTFEIVALPGLGERNIKYPLSAVKFIRNKT